MEGFLIIAACLFGLFGGVLLVGRSDVPAMLSLLIAAVLFVGGAVVGRLDKLRKALAPGQQNPPAKPIPLTQKAPP